MDNQKKNSFISELIDYIEIFVFSVCVALLVFTFAFRICRVDGDSMNNTLINNEILLISDINYQPEQNDIIVFHQTSDVYIQYNKPIVKRVIATAGQYVKINYDKGIVYVSDDNVFDENDILEESAYIYLDNGKWNSSGTLEQYVPEGYVFVMGDNRNNSADSRFPAIGLVDERRILGKVLIRIFPLSNAGVP